MRARMVDVPRGLDRQLRAWTLRDRLLPSANMQGGGEKNCTSSHSFFVAVGAIFFHRPLLVACSSAMMMHRAIEPGRNIVGANSWLQKVASPQQIAESLDDVFSLSSFRNAQWSQWLSLKVQVQPVLRCVLACGRSLRFRQGKKQPVCRLCRKALVYKGRNSEQD